MKNILTILMMGAFALGVTTACAKNLVGNGNVKEENRKVHGFNAIKIDGVFDVFLTQGNEESLLIEADDNLMEYIITEVHENTLKVYMKSNTSIKKKTKLNVYISLKSINKLSNNGVGDIKCQNNLKLDDLSINNNGVGDVTLKGSVNNLTVKNSGVGDLRAFELEAQNCKLRNSGVGDVEIYASNELRIINSGVGNVHYKGDAKITDIDSSGVGSVRKK